MTIPSFSTVPQRTDSRDVFATKADTHIQELNTFIAAANIDIAQANQDVIDCQAEVVNCQTEVTNCQAEVVNCQTEVTNAQAEVALAAAQVALATAQANLADASRIAAEGSSNATTWVSGATYALHSVAISPIDNRPYRRIVAGAGTTDPSLDAVNWLTTTPTTDPTKATLDKTFITQEQSTLTLSTATPNAVVSVQKEVVQIGVTNNNWTASNQNFTLEDTAYATTLTPGSIPATLGEASYDSVTFSVAAQDSVPEGFCFSNDGLKLFMVGSSNDRIYEYTLSVAYDISTLVYSQFIATPATQPAAITFNPTGTKMFVICMTGVSVHQYTLSAAFDISTVGASTSLYIGAQGGQPRGLAFNTTGTKMFTPEADVDEINEWNLGVAFDVTTAVFSQKFSTAAQCTFATNITFNSDGTSMYVLDYPSATVFEYTLSTGFDVSTASITDSFAVSGQETTPTGAHFSTDGLRLIVLGSISDAFHQYSVTTPALILGTGTFAAGDVSKTISGNGGVAVLTAADGSYLATTPFTDASTIASGNWTMESLANTGSAIEISNIKDGNFDLTSTVTHLGQYSVAAQATYPVGLAFNTDGTMMYVLDYSGKDITYYSLSIGFDLTSTVTHLGQYSVSAQETSPQGIAFNTDGTKMFIAGAAGRDITYYSLSIGFDLTSTVTHLGQYSVASSVTHPADIAFNTDGTITYVLDSLGYNVTYYSLSIGFDLTSTVTPLGQYLLLAQETAPQGIAFNTDGSKMFIAGAAGVDVTYYSLSIGFDLSSTVTHLGQYSVLAQETAPQGIAFNTDGSKMFIVGSTGDDVNYYTVGTYYTLTNSQETAIATLDSTYWTDLNAVTAITEALDSQTVNYALSVDGRTTWLVSKVTDGARNIVRNNAGTWEYNSNATYLSTTWTSATANTEYQAIRDAMTITANKMDSTQLLAVGDADFPALGNSLDLGVILNTTDATQIPSFTSAALNYDANILNEGAILGTDYDYDQPATDKVRITSLANNNLKIRVL